MELRHHAQLENRLRRCRCRGDSSSPFIVLRQGDALLGGTAGAATPSPAAPAMPVPVARIVKKDDPDLSGLFGAHGIDPQHHAPGQGARVISCSSTSRTAPTSRKAICSTRSIRATSRRRSIRPRRRCNATRRRSTMRARNLDRGTDARQERLSRQGQLRPAHQRRAAGRSGAGDGSGRRPHGRAQSRLYGNPRAVRRPPRPQPGSGRHADQRRRHAVEHAGAARSDLCHLQSERDGPGRDPEGAGGRARSTAEILLPGETQPRHEGRADLHRQYGRSLDRHHRRARDHRQRRSQLAARPVCARPAADRDASPMR